MMIRRTTRWGLLFLAAVALVPACSDDDGPTAPPDTDPYSWSDNEILGAVYLHWYPDDFYREDYSRGHPYYENTISIRADDEHWIELNTADFEQAELWSEMSAQNSAHYRELDSARVTEKYYEFRRVYEERPTDVILSRIHRTSYLVRSMFDRLHPTDMIGVFIQRPVTADAVRELVEYMWANRMIEYGNPLASQISECEGTFCCTILHAALVGGDWGLCDQIYLREAIVRVDAETGAVTFDVIEIRTIEGTCYD